MAARTLLVVRPPVSADSVTVATPAFSDWAVMPMQGPVNTVDAVLAVSSVPFRTEGGPDASGRETAEGAAAWSAVAVRKVRTTT